MCLISGRIASFLAALLVLAGQGCAQERPPQPKPDRAPRRLESVTWNSVKHELSWVISKGQRDGQSGAYKPLSTETYLINMDKATMSFNGETRGFSKQEAINVLALLDIVAKYAIESTIWWDRGYGQRLDEKGNPAGVTRVSLEPAPSSAALAEELAQRLEALGRRLREQQARQARASSPMPAGGAGLMLRVQ